VRRHYREARTAAKTDRERRLDLVLKMDKLNRSRRFVEVSADGDTVEVPDTCIALRYKKLGRTNTDRSMMHF
jgi:hypothetical protein